MKTNNLIYTETRIQGNTKIKVKISLNDECKNGHQDFHITCDGWEKHEGSNRFIESFGGSAHDEILKLFPEFKNFIALHGCDFNGIPSYVVGNGFYHLKNGFNSKSEGKKFDEEYIKYYRLTSEQYDILKDSKNQLEFAILLKELGILSNWKKEAVKCIKILEKLTGNEFLNDSKKNHYTEPKEQEIKEFKTLKYLGHFSKENKDIREKTRLEIKKHKSLVKIQNNLINKINKHQKEFDVKKAFLDFGFEICERTGNMKGAIYYNHTNELNFNWSTEKIKEIEILKFCEFLIIKRDFKGLKITNDKKEIGTI